MGTCLKVLRNPLCASSRTQIKAKAKTTAKQMEAKAVVGKVGRTMEGKAGMVGTEKAKAGREIWVRVANLAEVKVAMSNFYWIRRSREVRCQAETAAAEDPRSSAYM